MCFKSIFLSLLLLTSLTSSCAEISYGKQEEDDVCERFNWNGLPEPIQSRILNYVFKGINGTEAQLLEYVDIASTLQKISQVSAITRVLHPESGAIAEANFHQDISIYTPTEIVHFPRPRDHDIMAMTRCLAFSRDGSYLASRSDDGNAYLWNCNNGSQIVKLEQSQSPGTRVYLSLAISPNKKYTCGNEGKYINIWDNETGKVKFSVNTGQIPTFAFSTDSSELFAGCWSGKIDIWNLNEGTLITSLNGHNKPVRSLAMSRDGTLLASGSHDGVCIWNTKTRTVTQTFQCSRHVSAVAFSPDNAFVFAVTCGEKGTYIWNRLNGQLVQQLEGHKHWTPQIEMYPKNKELISIGEPCQDKCLLKWNLTELLNMWKWIKEKCPSTRTTLPTKLYSKSVHKQKLHLLISGICSALKKDTTSTLTIEDALYFRCLPQTVQKVLLPAIHFPKKECCHNELRLRLKDLNQQMANLDMIAQNATKKRTQLIQTQRSELVAWISEITKVLSRQ